MIIMQSREHHLKNTLEALTITDTPLISLNNGNYTISNYPDDLGIYYFIPSLAKSLGISIDLATPLFFYSLTFLAVIVAFFCFFFTFKHWSARLVSMAGLIMLAKGRFEEVYIAPFFAVALVVPIFILLNKKLTQFDWKFTLVLALSGIVAGYCNFIRSHAGTGALLFVSAWILLNQPLARKDKLLSFIVLLSFTSLPYLHFSYLETKRDQFLSKINPSHQRVSVTHPKWHAIYLGLSYLKNDYGIQWSDTVAIEKVKSLDPSIATFSKEYEQALKYEVLSISKADPIFILKTIFTKTYILILNILKFANLGLLFLFYVKPPIRYMIPFLVGAIFYSLPGILVQPPPFPYVSGMITISTIFGIYMICLSVEKFRRTAINPPLPCG